MLTCFVMQVFDGGEYDTRYEENFAPAITNAGAVPVRADKILGTRPVMDKIEEALRDATVAFADVSEDNANVFTEVGYALALKIPLVLACDHRKRERLPFDIQHRPVVFYKTGTAGGFRKLSEDLEAAVRAALVEADEQRSILPIADSITPSDKDALKTRIMMNILEAEMGDPEGLTSWRLSDSIAKYGYSDRILSLALLGLRQEGMIEQTSHATFNGDGSYFAYNLTDGARQFLLSQYADLLREEETAQIQVIKRRTDAPATFDMSDDTSF